MYNKEEMSKEICFKQTAKRITKEVGRERIDVINIYLGVEKT